jgi:hypothetical protein
VAGAAGIAEIAAPARDWAAGGLALLVAREVILVGAPLPRHLVAGAEALLGAETSGAADLPAFAQTLPARAAWALDDVRVPADLWRAEMRFWRRVESDGLRLARSPRFGLEPLVGAVVALVVDAWRARAALTLAARRNPMPEVLDELV